jgi:ubiquinone/menaquinone biosynthesis C-methylase UbiE
MKSPFPTPSLGSGVRNEAKQASGELRYRLRCIDKLGYAFGGTESLLDVGCGDGGVARLLRERVHDVVAIDVEPSGAWQDGPGLTFNVADGESLPFESASFDVVHSKDSLHHMNSPELAVAEYHRVLKPGGTVLIVEANRYNPIFFPHMTLALGHDHFTRARLRALVTAAFPNPRFGAFEAHYAPVLDRLLPLQNAVEEGLERLGPFRSLLSYNFAIAPR